MRASLDECGLIVVSTIKEPYLNLLIDTGANLNLIFTTVLQNHFPNVSLINSDKSISGVGEGIKSQSKIRIDLYFEPTPTNVTFHVCEELTGCKDTFKETGIQLHGIFGNEFLRKHKWIMDFSKMNIITN